MAHVFISYAHKNEDFVGELKKKLKNAGIMPMVDKDFLDAGTNWHDEIDRAIQNAFAVVVVLSPDAFESKYVTYEWAYAIGLGIEVIPIMFETTELHPRLALIQYIPFTAHFNLDSAWKQLTKTLKKLEQPKREIADNNEIMSLLDDALDEYRNGNLDGAVGIYETALSRASNHVKPQVCVQFAYVLGKLSQPDLARAEKLLDEALAIRTDFPMALATNGFLQSLIARQMKNDPQEANRLYIKAIGLLSEALNFEPYMRDMDNESWWGTLGGVYRRNDNLADAIKAYEQAVKVTPHSSYPRSNLALLYMANNQQDKMKRTYRVVERLARTKLQQYFADAWTHADLLISNLALAKYDEAKAAEEDFFDILPADLSQTVLGSYIDTLHRLSKVLTLDEAAQIQGFIDQAQAQLDLKSVS